MGYVRVNILSFTKSNFPHMASQASKYSEGCVKHIDKEHVSKTYLGKSKSTHSPKTHTNLKKLFPSRSISVELMSFFKSLLPPP